MPSGESATVSVRLTAPAVEGEYIVRHRVMSGADGFFRQVEERPITVAAVSAAAQSPAAGEAPDVSGPSAGWGDPNLRLAGTGAAWLMLVALLEVARERPRSRRRSAT